VAEISLSPHGDPPLKILDRYIGFAMARSTLLALTTLLAIFVFVTFLDDLDNIGTGSYTLWRALEYLLLTLPHHAFILFPVATLLGTLMGLGDLASHSELTVLRASGISQTRIALAVMKGGTLLTCLALLIGEVLGPVSGGVAEERRTLALTDQIAFKTSQGFWIRDGGNFIHVRKVLPDERVGDIFIYALDDKRRLISVTYAKDARYQGKQWLLEGIESSEITEQGISRHVRERMALPSLFDADLLKAVAVRPETLSLQDLYDYIAYLKANGLRTVRQETILWSRLLYPVTAGVMMLLPLPLVLSQTRLANMGQRIVVGTLLGIGYFIIFQIWMQAGVVYGFHPLLSAAAPTLLFLVVTLGLWMKHTSLGAGVFLCRRMRKILRRNTSGLSQV
jgi:lipopolysaccharide export system permease protein